MKSHEAQQEDAIASGAPEKVQRKSPVFDFLYHDARRGASLLAQFSDYGHLVSVKATELVGQSAIRKTNVALSGSIPALASAQGVLDQSVANGERDSAERTYNPIWASAITFINYLNDKELLNSPIQESRIGQFVTISATPSMFDVGLFQKIWELPTIRSAILKAAAMTGNIPGLPNRQERRRQGSVNGTSGGAGKPITEQETALELINTMPHTAVATIQFDEISAWCALREEFLTVPTSDILLKYGAAVSGTWTMIGILDALPDDPDTEVGGLSSRVIAQMAAGASVCNLGRFFANMIAPVRKLLGRPDRSFGVTPLLICRQID